MGVDVIYLWISMYLYIYDNPDVDHETKFSCENTISNRFIIRMQQYILCLRRQSRPTKLWYEVGTTVKVYNEKNVK